MKTQLTSQQEKRVRKELETTKAKLNKELAISEDLQYKDRISEMKKHISHLENMLIEGWEAPKFN